MHSKTAMSAVLVGFVIASGIIFFAPLANDLRTGLGIFFGAVSYLAGVLSLGGLIPDRPWVFKRWVPIVGTLSGAVQFLDHNEAMSHQFERWWFAALIAGLVAVIAAPVLRQLFCAREAGLFETERSN